MKSVKSIVALAMENQEEETTEIVSYDPAEHDAAVGAVEEGHREVEEAVAAIDTVEEVGAGIESLIATLEGLDAPLNTSSATFMNIAAESHLMRVGLDMSDSPLIASFENEGATATRLSVDSLKSKLRAIWDAIKKAVMNAYQSLVTFVKNVFDANSHLEKRAKALQLKHIDRQAKARTEVIEDAALAKKLHTAGATNDLVNQFVAVASFIEGMSVSDTHEAPPHRIVGQTATMLAQADSKEAIDKAFEHLKQLKMAPTKAFPTAVKVDKGHEHRSNDLPGGVYFVFMAGEDNTNADGLTHAKQFIEGYQIQERHSEVKGEISNKLPVLVWEEIQKISIVAIEIAESNKKADADVKSIERDFLELSKRIEDSKLGEGLPSEQVARISAFNRLIGRSFSIEFKRMGVILRYNTRCARDFIAYAEKSYALYDVAKKEKATDQKPTEAAATA